MLRSIKEFVFNLNPEVFVQTPSRINLINPLDAVEGDFWMPSVAINGTECPLSTFLYIKTRKRESNIKIYRIKQKLDNYEFQIEYEEKLMKEKFEEKFSGKCALIYASIFRLYRTNEYFRKDFINNNFEIGLISTIPKQSGLGGSASIIIAVLYGFAKYFSLINNLSTKCTNGFPINKDIIAELATKIEDEDLKITSGYGDRYTICRGGLSFCSYYGKLYHEQISNEPLAVYDRIDKIYNIKELPIIVCFSGVIHESGQVHQKLRDLYLKKEPFILKKYKSLAEVSWKSRFALMSHNWKLLGKLFKKNTEIMNEIMKRAGFKFGIGLTNNILIELIESHSDVYAAKLTGAGGGGSVFALVNPDKIELVYKDWKHNLDEIIENKDLFTSKFPSYPIEITKNLRNAKFYRIKIDEEGVKELK